MFQGGAKSQRGTAHQLSGWRFLTCEPITAFLLSAISCLFSDVRQEELKLYFPRKEKETATAECSGLYIVSKQYKHLVGRNSICVKDRDNARKFLPLHELLNIVQAAGFRDSRNAVMLG